MKFAFALLFTLVVMPAIADPATGPATTPAATAISVPQPNVPALPLVDPSRELKGAELLKALQRGDLVLYLRHTDTGKVTPDCKESNLSTLGEEQAAQLGNALRDLRIPFGQRESSEICRVRDTARLLGLGAFQTNEDLNNVPKRAGHDLHAARMRRLALPPARGTNTLLVGHIHAGDTPNQRLFLDLGEIIVFRPDGKGGSEPIARIRLAEWAELQAR